MFPCEDCGKKYSSHSGLDYHRWSVHDARRKQFLEQRASRVRERRKEHGTRVRKTTKLRKMFRPRGHKKNFDSYGALLILAECRWRKESVAA